jgi:hypothetical protein
MISINSISNSNLACLFALAIQNLKLFCCVTDFPKNSCLSCIGSPNDEYGDGCSKRAHQDGVHRRGALGELEGKISQSVFLIYQ